MVDAQNVALRRRRASKRAICGRIVWDSGLYLAADGGGRVKGVTGRIVRPVRLDWCEVLARVIHFSDVDRAAQSRGSDRTAEPKGNASWLCAQPEKVADGHQRVKAALLVQDPGAS